jgi:uncharacterized protein (UPF0261 family)
MFGVTTLRQRARGARGAASRSRLHATGAGGRTLESCGGRLLAGVLDITTTELADELGGVPPGTRSTDRGGLSRIPQVVSVGALDMVNFHGIETVSSASARGSSTATTRTSP